MSRNSGKLEANRRSAKMQIRRMERRLQIECKTNSSAKSPQPSALSRFHHHQLITNRELFPLCSLLLAIVLLVVSLVELSGLTQADKVTVKAVVSQPKSDPILVMMTTQTSGPPSSDNSITPLPTSETLSSGTTKSKLGHDKASTEAADLQRWASSQAGSNIKKCNYDKGQWDRCEPNGSQQKIMRLKAGDRTDCKPTKTIRRDCRTGELGCKYSRGEWSSVCRDGQRVRIDTLVGLIGADGSELVDLSRANERQPMAAVAARCKPQRRVTKDCTRTCHYVKSAWSKCSPDGFRMRVLTLDEQLASEVGTIKTRSSPDAPGDQYDELPSGAGVSVNARGRENALAPATTTTMPAAALKQRPKRTGDNQICARQKLIRRECRANSKVAFGQLQQQQANAQAGSNGVSGGASNMKQVQRRRLNQIQLKQPTPTPRSGSTTSRAGSNTKMESGGPSTPSQLAETCGESGDRQQAS